MSAFRSSSSSSSSSSSPPSTTASSSSSSICSLRIILINDVYELENFPRFKTARNSEATAAVPSTGQSKPDLCFAVIAGDFLAPSMLSSVDKGRGMVDCLNRSDINYCCIGNHEGDLNFNEFVARVAESKFTWVNSNIPDLKQHFEPLGLSEDSMPEYVIIEVESEDRANKRRVALMGLCCEDPAVLMPRAFKGCLIEPLNAKAAELYKKIMQTENVDAIIPMTHQFMYLDRELAAQNVGFPLILGGHDHEPFLETISSCTIVKSGSNAKCFASCDLVWESSCSPRAPSVNVTLKEVKDYDPDVDLEDVVKSHTVVLEELSKMPLFPICLFADLKLSSKGMRLMPTTMGTFFCNIIKMELNAECALVGGGCIRANRDYEDEEHFTYSHLKTELPFETGIIVVYIPGSLISDIIAYTRSFALSNPPVATGAYFQTDGGIQWDADTNKVTAIDNKPINLDKVYKCCINFNTLVGMDNVVPLLNFKANMEQKYDRSGVHKSEEYSHPIKNLVVNHFLRDNSDPLESMYDLFKSPESSPRGPPSGMLRRP